MFTGIIQAIGTLSSMERSGADMCLHVSTGDLRLDDVGLGDSISTNGVCLTVVALPGDGYIADLSVETLSLSTLASLRPGARLNLEKALTLNTPLGGHLVSGHIDGIGQVLSRKQDGRSIRFEIEAPQTLARYIAQKGSICVDGVSLTVNAVNGSRFELNIVPHTLEKSIMSDYLTGTRVNLEVDLIARYLERLLLADGATVPGSGKGLTLEILARHGFLRD